MIMTIYYNDTGGCIDRSLFKVPQARAGKPGLRLPLGVACAAYHQTTNGIDCNRSTVTFCQITAETNSPYYLMLAAVASVQKPYASVLAGVLLGVRFAEVRGDGVAQLVERPPQEPIDSMTRVQTPSGAQEQFVRVPPPPIQKCADSLSVLCPTPVCTHTHA